MFIYMFIYINVPLKLMYLLHELSLNFIKVLFKSEKEIETLKKVVCFFLTSI